MLGKQAKILSDGNIRDLLAFTTHTRYPERNQTIALLSVKAGLRAGEIANLTWDMVTDSIGNIGTVIALEDRVAKKKSDRIIPLHLDVGEDAAGCLRASPSRLFAGGSTSNWDQEARIVGQIVGQATPAPTAITATY
jgi:integrase/recombinase XerD